MDERARCVGVRAAAGLRAGISVISVIPAMSATSRMTRMLRAGLMSGLGWLWLAGLLGTGAVWAMEGPGGGENDPFAGASNQASADFYSGAATLSVPIQIPPGRVRTTPDLGLAYSSHGGLSPVGLGWSMTTGVLTRSTRHGVPRCEGPFVRSFQVALNGSTNDLVETTPGYFQLRVDDGYADAFPQEDENHWVLRSRDGLRYTFGADPSARVHTGADVFTDASSCEFTTAWHLTRIEDGNGNHVEIQYEKSGQTPIPVSIEYGGNDSAQIADPFRVRFELEDLPPGKARRRSFRSGVDQSLSRRVRSIFVESWNLDGGHFEEIRRYRLEYDDSPRTTDFLLTKIEGSGMPPRTFRYSQAEPTIVAGLSGRIPTESIYLNRQFTTGSVLSNRDMNGDGLIDRIRMAGSEYRVSYGEPGGEDQFSAQEYLWSLPSGSGVPAPDRIGAEDLGVDYYLVQDLTGDGKPDFVYRDASAGVIRVHRGRCWTTNRDCGFEQTAELWTNPDNLSIRYAVASQADVGGGQMVFRDLIDMNGDGLPDLARGVSNGLEVFLNTGDDFESAPIFLETGEHFLSYGSNGTTFTIGNETQMIDVNGDGLPDRVRGAEFFSEFIQISQRPPRPPLSTWHRAPATYYAVTPENAVFGPYALDGGPYLCPEGVPAANVRVSLCEQGGSPVLPSGWAIVPAISVQLGTGTGFTERIYSPAPYAMATGGESPRLRSSAVFTSAQSVFPYRNFVDMNGDGLVDWVASALPAGDPENGWAVLYNQGDGRFGNGNLRYVSGLVRTPSGDPLSHYGDVRATSVIDTGWRWLGQSVYHTSSSPPGLSDQYSHVFDLDGDGLPEMVTSVGAPADHWNVFRIEYQEEDGSHVKPHLLMEARDGVGGQTHFRYEPSGVFAGAEGAPREMPFSVWVVTGARRTDGLCDDVPADWFTLAGNPCLAAGHELVQSVAYRNGVFDSVLREFRGFGEVEVFDGPRERGTLRQLSFYQDEARKGRLHVEEIFAGETDLFSRKTFDWQVVTRGERIQVYLSEQRNEEFALYANGQIGADANQCVVHRNSLLTGGGHIDGYTRVQTSCSMACGAVAESAEGCEPEPVGKKQLKTTWAQPLPYADFPVWDRPRAISTEFVDADGSVQFAGLTLYEYDHLESGIDRGNLTRERNAVSLVPFAFAERQIEYDNDGGPGVGNIVSVVVPVMGQVREPDRTTYDAAFRLYPQLEEAPSTMDAEGNTVEHRTWTEYDLRYGKVASKVGRQGAAAGDVSGAVYDSQGRPVCRYEPGTSCEGGGEFSASVEIEYGYGNPDAAHLTNRLSWTAVRTREPNAPNGYLVSRTYRDALGRERLSVHERNVVASGEAGGTSAIEDVVVRQFDYGANGKKRMSWAPYVLGNRPLSLAAPAGVSAETFEYALNGNREGASGLGFWDPAGRVARSMNHDGGETVRSFFGRLHQRIDAEGHLIAEWLDEHGRVVRKEVFEGTGTRLTSVDRMYGGRDQIVREWFGGDPATAIEQEHDLLGRLIGKHDPDSGRWTARFDEAGNKIFSNDPATGQSIQTCYDEHDRVVLECALADDEYQPGLCGQAQPVCSTRYAYEYDGTAPMGGETNFGVGRLTRVTGPASSHRFGYDVRGRITRQVDEVLGETATTEYGFERGIDRVETMVYPDGERVRYGYDASGQGNALWEEDADGRWLASYVASVDYDLRGRPLRVVRGNGTRETYAYHGAEDGYRASRVRVDGVFGGSDAASGGQSGGALVDLRFEAYDGNGRLSEISDLRNAWGPLSMSALYAYDGAGRLREVTGPQPETFVYDPIGNLRSMSQAGADRVFRRSAEGAGALGPHQFDRFGLPDGTDWIIEFDANGRRRSKVRSDGSGEQRYGYDGFGRLATLTVGGQAKSILYDHAGQRVAESRAGQTRRYWGPHAETEAGVLYKYYRLGDRLIATRTAEAVAVAAVTANFDAASADGGGAHGFAAMERFASKWPLSGVSSLRPLPPLPPEAYWFIMSLALALLLVPLGQTRRTLGLRVSQGGALGGALLVAAMLLPMAVGVSCVSAPEIRHFHTSHRGSPVAITNGTGGLERQLRYSAYGQVRRYDAAGLAMGIDPGSRHEFTGYSTDPESELQYAGARFYDPSHAQFLSMDPREMDPNPYAYVGWDPVNQVDPNGESALESVFLGLLGLAAALAAVQGIVVAIETSSIANGFKAAGLSFATSFLGSVAGYLLPQAGALLPFVTEGLAQASVTAAGIGYSAYGIAGASSTQDAVFAGVGLALSIGLSAYGLAMGSGGRVSSTSPGEPIPEPRPSAATPASPGVQNTGSGGAGLDLVQQLISSLRMGAEARSIRGALSQNQAELARLRAEAVSGGTVRGRPVLDNNVTAFEVFEFTVDSLGNQSFNSSMVAVEFSRAGAALPTRPSLISPSGSHLMHVQSGPHPIACGGCGTVRLH